jgi:hypothetical protein
MLREIAMKRFTPIEWQSFSQKKNIEQILKRLDSVNSFGVSIIWEMVLIVFSVGLTNVFQEILSPRELKNGQIIIYSLAFLPIVIFFICFAWSFYKRKRLPMQLSPRNFIDQFDNEICYNAFMAESFYSMLLETNPSKENSPIAHAYEETKQFYYIEASYYFMKATQALCPFYFMKEKVVSTDPEMIIGKKLIAYARYENILSLLKKIFLYLEANENILEGLPEQNSVIATNKKMVSNLKAIQEKSSCDFLE